MKNILVVLVFIISSGLCNAQENNGVQFLNISLEEAFVKAKQEGKQVFVNYTTKGCAPCKIMDASVYTEANIAKKMNENFISIKLDPIKDKKLEKIAREVHKVRGFPTMIFFKSGGDLISQEVGGKTVAEFNLLLVDVLKQISLVRSTCTP